MDYNLQRPMDLRYGGPTRRVRVALILDLSGRPSMGLVEFLTVAGLVFINGFFVAAEFALVKVRTSQIDQLAEKGNWAAKMTSRAPGPARRLPVGVAGRHHGGEPGAGLGDREAADPGD